MPVIKKCTQNRYSKLLLLLAFATLVVATTTACSGKQPQVAESALSPMVTSTEAEKMDEEATTVYNNDSTEYLRSLKSAHPESEELYGVMFKTVSDVVYSNCDAVLKKTPNENSPDIGILQYGDMVLQLGISENGWSRIVHYGDELFVNTGCLQSEVPAPRAENRGISHSNAALLYVNKAVNVRSGPGKSYPVLGILYVGDTVEPTGVEKNGWAQISYNGANAYVYSTYLQSTNPDA